MREEDIRPENLFNEYLRLSKNDAYTLFADAKSTEINCPACDSTEKQQAFIKDGFTYQICKHCQTLYQSPRPEKIVFDKFYINSASSNFWGEKFFPKVAEARRKKIFHPRCQAIVEKCQLWEFEPQTLIDVGAGYGILLEEWKKINAKTELLAIEPGETLSKICIEKGFETLISTAEDAKPWHQKADLLTCFEVIEHAYSPFNFASALKNIVKPGKKVLVTGLCGDGFDIQTLWKYSKSVSPPHHINFMSAQGFELLFERAGFTNIEIETPGKLDFDIVINTLKDENIKKQIKLSRFENYLIYKSTQTQKENFQQFLAKNQLSSHCWIWAERSLSD